MPSAVTRKALETDSGPWPYPKRPATGGRFRTIPPETYTRPTPNLHSPGHGEPLVRNEGERQRASLQISRSAN